METKRNRKIFNIAMVVLIVCIAACGIIAIGNFKGWFNDDSSVVKVAEVQGVTNIERKGVAYALKKNAQIQPGDNVETKNGSQVLFNVEKDNTIRLNDNAEILFKTAKKDDVGIQINHGEIFVDAGKAPKKFYFKYGGSMAEIKGTVFSISAQDGSSTLNVFEGKVTVKTKAGKTYDIKKGKCLSIAKSGKGKIDEDIRDIQAKSLNDFTINSALKCKDSKKLCFSKTVLKKVIADREKEKTVAAAGKDSGDNKDGEDESETASDKDGHGGTGGGSSSSKHSKSKQKSENTDSSAGNASNGGSQGKKCNITIRCDTILNNMGDLEPGKERFVPGSGVILGTTTVEFTDGETVFDVLKRVCSRANIQLEYSWTPMYESYYIEGINNLYEFDCGEQSGWMYKVDGWFPNYGCSKYVLKGGDTIVWCYTCKGLGADVGGSVM